MYAKVTSLGVTGLAGYIVQVEADLSGGLPQFNLVGLPDSAVKESSERVRSAIKNLHYEWPASRITINLAPADVRKTGPVYDLPVFVGIMAAQGKLPAPGSERAFLGELGLDGTLRPVTGVLPMALAAVQNGVKELFLPAENAAEAAVAEGLTVYPARMASDVARHLCGKEAITPATPGGFDAGSYREKASPEQAVQLTPLQQKLAGLEAKLPAALTRQAVALALSIVVMLAAFAGFGSAKVRSKYNTARQWFTVGVSADNGYNLSEELTARANTAANVITTAGNTLGADNAEVQTAQAALDDFSACLDAVQSGGKSQALTSLSYYNGSSMHALYQANETLGKAIDQLYAKLQEQAADPMKMGAVQGQYGQFNSAGTIIGTLKYNEAVYNYQNEVGGFPANVLGGLAGVKEVEPFA